VENIVYYGIWTLYLSYLSRSGDMDGCIERRFIMVSMTVKMEEVLMIMTKMMMRLIYKTE